MRKYIILILVFNFACLKEVRITSEGKNITYQVGKKSPKSSEGVIHFMDGFTGLVAVFKNGELVVEKEMYSDKSLSYAGYILISDLTQGDSLTIKFKNEVVNYSFNLQYPEIEIYNFSDSIKVNFSRINSIKTYE